MRALAATDAETVRAMARDLLARSSPPAAR